MTPKLNKYLNPEAAEVNASLQMGWLQKAEARKLFRYDWYMVWQHTML